MTYDQVTYVPLEDEQEPSSFYEFYEDLTSTRNPWDHHHDADEIENFYPDDQTPPF